jgi:hypothetical protein
MLAASAVDAESNRTVTVWIEDVAGAIARGVAVSVTTGGTRVRLAAKPAFAEGDAVSLRLSLQPGAPTIAMTARVAWVRCAGVANECGLEWTGSGEQRIALAGWLAAGD